MNGLALIDVLEAGRDAGMAPPEAVHLTRVVWTRQGRDPSSPRGADDSGRAARDGKRDLVALVASERATSSADDGRSVRPCNGHEPSPCARPDRDARQETCAEADSAAAAAVDALLATFNSTMSGRFQGANALDDVADGLEAGLTGEDANGTRPVAKAEKPALHQLFITASFDELTATRYCEGCAASGVRASQLEALFGEGKRTEVLATLRAAGVLSVGHQQRIFTALGRASGSGGTQVES